MSLFEVVNNSSPQLATNKNKPAIFDIRPELTANKGYSATLLSYPNKVKVLLAVTSSLSSYPAALRA